jgi:hypothetical protein
MEMEVKGSTDLMTAFMHNGHVSWPAIRGVTSYLDDAGTPQPPAGGQAAAGGGKPDKPKRPRPKAALTAEEQLEKTAKRVLKLLGDHAMEAGSWGPKMRAAGSPEALCLAAEQTLLPHAVALKDAHDRLTALLAGPACPSEQDLEVFTDVSKTYLAERGRAQKLATKASPPKAAAKAKAKAKAGAAAPDTPPVA